MQTVESYRTPRVKTATALLVIFLFVLLITLPFVEQAFHIDDAIFWDFAKHNLEHPFSLHLDNYHLMGEDFGQWRDTHPPVDSLYMSLVMLVTGSDAEAPLHAGFILFPLISGVSMYFLARRFTKNSLAATLSLLATPVVMTMSHTLMADMAMIAFWLAATACYVYGVDRNDLRLLTVSSVLVTVDIFTGYQAMSLLVLLPAYPLLSGRLSPKNILPLALPVFCFALYVLYNLQVYGELPRLAHAGGTSFKSGSLLDRLQGMLLQTGGTSLFAPVLIVIFSLRRKRYLLLPFFAAAAAISGWSYYHAGELTGASLAIYITLLTAGLVVVAALVIETTIQLINAVSEKSVDTEFLFLASWTLIMLVATIILLPHVPAKYILPFLAPLVLLAFREVDTLPLSRKNLNIVAAVIVVLTLASGVTVSIADYRLAATYRDFVADFSSSQGESGEVWFVGEWGFRHYMEARGYKYLSSNNDSPSAGDLVVQPTVAEWPLDPDLELRLRLKETVDVDWAVPIRLMSHRANAGLYGTYWGILPYAVADVPVETFAIYEVQPTQQE